VVHEEADHNASVKGPRLPYFAWPLVCEPLEPHIENRYHARNAHLNRLELNTDICRNHTSSQQSSSPRASLLPPDSSQVQRPSTRHQRRPLNSDNEQHESHEKHVSHASA
jgi:hypothetical protein